MARHGGGKGRPAWSWVGVIAVALGLGTVTTASAGSRAGIEPNPVAQWVAADAPIYLEVARPAVLIDHLLERRLQAVLDAVSSDKRSSRATRTASSTQWSIGSPTRSGRPSSKGSAT
jgi:hypothetical protein